MSNFAFLQAEWSSLHEKAIKAEARVNTEPYSTAVHNRLIIEECLHSIYQFEQINLPYDKQLSNLLREPALRAVIPHAYQNGLRIIRITGNNAAHYGKRVSAKDAMRSLRYLYDFLKWFAINYSEVAPILSGAFDKVHIPKIGAAQRALKIQQAEQQKAAAALQAKIEQLEKEKEAALEEAQFNELKLAVFKEQQAEEKARLVAQKLERIQPVAREYTEAETRKHLIDAALKEAAWFNLEKGRELEFPVKGMPINRDNPKGNGFVDYVLWDDNGKPLALIEAKRTSANAEIGRHQAYLYANCLEQQFGRRPIIFYSNGFETYIWEDTFYSSPRLLYGFYTKEELQWAMQQRQSRKDIRLAKVNAAIAGRPYQMEAIQRITETLVVDSATGMRGNRRNGLLVMATGSGKTRTSAALVELLFQHNWVKRVLFLADRNALVSQAKNNYSEYLPDLSAIDLTKEKENDTTRLVFSTYPSMLNRIDKLSATGERFYGVGHFDLIIVDEAHRSVYNRYKAIFDYFDALVVGLTATPKDSIHHNTYDLFGCSDKDPTFEYPFEEAIPTYLSDYKNLDVSTEFLREGIKYQELSDTDKAKYEESFRDTTTGLFPEEIKANAMNKWLFNEDTVNKVLDALMEEGLRIEGGDKLGRTLIFAVNQKHANYIVTCFRKRYPEQSEGFIETIHNKVSHAQSLIDAFCEKEKENDPQIAVSVDMMDTGIDAPRVLNLVFFKVVRSYAKFWQMIGRGTRLCPDIFGPGKDKDQFLIFDVCQNFDFFSENKKGKQSGRTKSITRQIFETRLQLSELLIQTGLEEHLALAKTIRDNLHFSINQLNKDRFQVKMKLRYVDQYKDRATWNNLNSEDLNLINEHLSALPAPESVDETARRFDLMMLKLQVANLLTDRSEQAYHEKLMTTAQLLSGKYGVPAVLNAKPLIEKMKGPDFYKALSQQKLNEIREEIRGLVNFLESKGKEPIYTNIQDSVSRVEEGVPLSTYGSVFYKKRVERFLRENKTQLTIAKISTNQPITAAELEQLETILFDGTERGSKTDFEQAYGEQTLGTFVRSILGLEVAAAQQAFADFLQAGTLRADQMTFVQNIITYLTKNGVIEKKMLFESPFTDVHDGGLLGVFDDAAAMRIMRIIEEVNGNAVA